ncbi:3, 5 -cyclic-nucleotide phosphodiesterase [Lecanosticta acicola]|uniref:3,5 -cyclic-nucleotide phosphodiesterase n=1 Tax=Lecanosticta acicola TaxID=111012 RepID=A0AAI8YXE1_9PEZI|nr:3, 5 -cyclic-nucleotide phosphodiesterase [Lecanosticta acicola]
MLSSFKATVIRRALTAAPIQSASRSLPTSGVRKASSVAEAGDVDAKAAEEHFGEIKATSMQSAGEGGGKQHMGEARGGQSRVKPSSEKSLDPADDGYGIRWEPLEGCPRPRPTPTSAPTPTITITITITIIRQPAATPTATCASMKDSGNETAGSHIGLHGHKPALQVICLGNSGGPSEENVTGFLVRSVGSEWAKNSLLAVDAGSHLAPITRILERSFPPLSGGGDGRTDSNGRHPLLNGNNSAKEPSPTSTSPSSSIAEDELPEPTVLSSGPFAGLKLPNKSARANALHLLRTYITTYLITHPHLDHLSGFAINTAAFHATSRPKTLAALPSTVNAIKDHIFNDIIWPNLTDEDGGVGFVTFQRLKEGGDVMLGEGEGRGYIDVCDGLGAKAFKVSHGTCTKSPPAHQHRGSIPGLSDSHPPYNGSIQGSSGSQDHGSVAAHRSLSITQLHSTPGTPGGTQRPSFHASHASPSTAAPACESSCVVDSTAFFLRDEHTQREVLIFGDVEPDALSMMPRNKIIWQEAARRIAHRRLGGIFIECSYDDSQPDALLFGHLSPKHLIAELKTLAGFVMQAKEDLAAERASKKRKRSAANGLDNFARNAFPEKERKRSHSLVNRMLQVEDKRRSSAPDGMLPDMSAVVPTSTPPPSDSNNQYDFHDPITHSIESASPKTVSFPSYISGGGDSSGDRKADLPLSGIRVVIIHIKDTMKDGPHVSENILAELQESELRLQAERGLGLGCEFVISQSGESYWF